MGKKLNMNINKSNSSQIRHYKLTSLNNRVSTSLTEQISRRFPGDSRRDFKKIQDMFALLRPAM